MLNEDIILKQRELPIAETPIKVLQYLAYPLCIILNYEECWPWVYKNYIQLEFVNHENQKYIKFIDGWNIKN